MIRKRLEKVPDDFFKEGHYYKIFFIDEDEISHYAIPLVQKKLKCIKKGAYPCDAYFEGIQKTCFRDFIIDGYLLDVGKEYTQEELEI